jgi:spore maturation protein CgeB
MASITSGAILVIGPMAPDRPRNDVLHAVRFVMFYQSLVSDWSNDSAHFLRGIAGELGARGHEVVVYEPADGWSRRNLLVDQGPGALAAFARVHPGLNSQTYDRASLDLEAAIAGADVVVVHEWNEPDLVNDLGKLASRRPGGPRLLFHDTHHRLVSQPAAMGALDLQAYDGVLAFGAVLAEAYRTQGRCRRAFVWHEAADTRVFFPRARPVEADLVWIGSWGDEARSQQLEELLIEPVRELGLSARVYGARYSSQALAALARAGIEYRGWLPGFELPEVFARHRLTIHVPRREYAVRLPGIPTIRPFEALACAVPLVCAPWSDREALFSADRDYLIARDGREMKRQIARLLAHPVLARKLAAAGLSRIRQAHTCGHRVRELFAILEAIDRDRPQGVRRRSGADLTQANP